jgi:hypothetical protein
MRYTYLELSFAQHLSESDMSMHAPKIATSFLVLLTTACSADPDAPAGEPEDLESTLAVSRAFEIDGADSELRAVAVALREDTENLIEFEIVSGEVELSAAGGALSIEAVEVALADVMIPETVLPRGLVITGMLITLDAPVTAPAEWTTDGRRADVSLSVDLTVEWAMLRDGTVFPLADVHLRDLPLQVGVTRDGDSLDIDVAADRTGAFWSWADTFELRDLAISLAGVY